MRDKESEERKKQEIDRRKSEISAKLTSSATPSQIAMLQSDLSSLMADAQGLNLDLGDFIALQNAIQATMQKQLSLAETEYMSSSPDKELTDQEIIAKMEEHRKNFASSLDKYHQSIDHSKISATHKLLGSGKTLDDNTMKVIRVDDIEYGMRKQLKNDRTQLDADYHLAHSKITGFEQEIQKRETEIEDLQHKLRQNPDDRALYGKIKTKKDELKNIEAKHMKAFDVQVAANDQTLQSKKGQLSQVEEADNKRFAILTDQQKLKRDERNAEAEKRLQETKVSSQESVDVTKLKEQRQEQEKVREQRRLERTSATKIQALVRGRQARQQAQNIAQGLVIEKTTSSAPSPTPSKSAAPQRAKPGRGELSI